MKLADTPQRIVLAVTETTPVNRLWGAAMRLLEDSPGELVTLYVEEDRWHRVASLPFTREVSRTGRVADFTLSRADQIQKDAIARIRAAVHRLAEEARLESRFEILPESDVERLRKFLDNQANVLVAPAFISSRPVYSVLSKLECRILLVEVPEEQDQNGEDSGSAAGPSDDARPLTPR